MASNSNTTTTTTTTTTTNLSDSVRETLQSIVQSHKEEHDALDVYRVVQNEARLLYHTQRVRDQVLSDPFERFRNHDNSHAIRSDIERLCQSLHVVDFDHVVTKMGYVCIEAKVRILVEQQGINNHHKKSSNVKLPKNNNSSNRTKQQEMELRFRYERDAIPEDPSSSLLPCSVNYVIEFCRDPLHGPSVPLLWVHVTAEGGGLPSHLQAQCLNDDEEDDDDNNNNKKKKTDGGSSDSDEWSDMDENENDDENGNGEKPATKRTKTEPIGSTNNTEKARPSPPEQQKESPDKFIAGIDPDVLQSFLKVLKFGKMDDATAFFLLMSFPFYEHEWDLVGYVLDAVFGMESSDEESDGDGEEEQEHPPQQRKVRRKG